MERLDEAAGPTRLLLNGFPIWRVYGPRQMGRRLQPGHVWDRCVSLRLRDTPSLARPPQTPQPPSRCSGKGQTNAGSGSGTWRFPGFLSFQLFRLFNLRFQTIKNKLFKTPKRNVSGGKTAGDESYKSYNHSNGRLARLLGWTKVVISRFAEK